MEFNTIRHINNSIIINNNNNNQRPTLNGILEGLACFDLAQSSGMQGAAPT